MSEFREVVFSEQIGTFRPIAPRHLNTEEEALTILLLKHGALPADDLVRYLNQCQEVMVIGGVSPTNPTIYFDVGKIADDLKYSAPRLISEGEWALESDQAHVLLHAINGTLYKLEFYSDGGSSINELPRHDQLEFPFEWT